MLKGGNSVDYRSRAESSKNTVEFEIEEDLSAISGIALLNCWGQEGQPIVSLSFYGDTKPVEIIGILQTTLDQYRWNFIDKGYNILEDDEEDDDLGGDQHR